MLNLLATEPNEYRSRPPLVFFVLVLISISCACHAQRHESSDQLRTVISALATAPSPRDSELDASLDQLSLAPSTITSSLTTEPNDIDLRFSPVAAGENQKEDVPFRLQNVLRDGGAPAWLRISGQIRLRYEGIDGQFRTAARLDDTDHLLFLRTLLKVEADLDAVLFTLELQDSRHFGGNRKSALDPGSINTVELLQALMTIRLGNLGTGTNELRLGRQTFDLGSRRLVARNRFRNTINAFTGAFWQWRSEDFKLSAFYTLPIRRRPSDIASVANNQLEFDREDFDLEFFGTDLEHRLFERHSIEVYFFGLLDDVKNGLRREIYTFGTRLLLPKARGSFDYGVEGAYQFGKSQLATAGPDLDHSAGFAHAHVGYTFDTAWSPRIVLAFDFASGDTNPNDGKNGRFDPLFGQPFELGPTGIYTALNRFNLISPVLRFELSPQSNIQLALAWRPAWVASDRDIGTSAQLQDTTGSSGSLIGNQFDLRLRWDVLPKSLQLEAGLVYLARGEFLKDAPGAQGKDTLYQYLQIRWTF